MHRHVPPRIVAIFVCAAIWIQSGTVRRHAAIRGRRVRQIRLASTAECRYTAADLARRDAE